MLLTSKYPITCLLVQDLHLMLMLLSLFGKLLSKGMILLVVSIATVCVALAHEVALLLSFVTKSRKMFILLIRLG